MGGYRSGRLGTPIRALAARTWRTSPGWAAVPGTFGGCRKLSRDLASVGIQNLFTATNRPEMLAGVVLLLPNADSPPTLLQPAELQPEAIRRTNTI